MGDFEEMCTLHAVIMLCFCCWQGLANCSMRIQDLYVGAFPIPRFIKNNSIRGQNVVGLRQVCGRGLDARPGCGVRANGLQADMDSSTQDSATSGGCG